MMIACHTQLLNGVFVDLLRENEEIYGLDRCFDDPTGLLLRLLSNGSLILCKLCI